MALYQVRHNVALLMNSTFHPKVSLIPIFIGFFPKPFEKQVYAKGREKVGAYAGGDFSGKWNARNIQAYDKCHPADQGHDQKEHFPAIPKKIDYPKQQGKERKTKSACHYTENFQKKPFFH